MTRLNRPFAMIAAGLALAAAPAAMAATMQTSAGPVSVTAVATGLEEPWGFAFLPDGSFLVTERSGRLTLHDGKGATTVVRGGPDVVARGQGGLLDVMIPRDFAESREVFLTYAGREGSGAGTALAAGTLAADGTRLENLRVLFQAPGVDGNGHFGSRVVEAPDGYLFLTTGDRQKFDPAQDMSRIEGKVLRLNRDGSVPADNPFVDEEGARPEIWSLGHRNIQGAAIDASGQLWVNEHGAKGGDEVNRVERGGNYGWPVISYGVHYDGSSIGEGTRQQGMEQPVLFWDPSMAPSGYAIHTGEMFSDWEGDHFIGSLKFDYIARLDPQNGFTEERLKSPETARVRAVEVAPDGSIWFASVGDGAIYRMAPQGADSQ
ncbi:MULTISPECIES: PQQ-dependent sugar dehydrogenase [unclassified Haematobacter]|uniref:PQQ-dependent sugar dehydrogenase n=1 Tax=unclassified Haematobacter TaxID=2640585 RepID=UPI0025BCA072|nr:MULTISPECIES: PQQ-dependent sugar dehydrogenase [unclassified Haematobacter]